MTTSNPRTYVTYCKGYPTDTLVNIVCSAYDAAKNYVQEFLPGYTLISCNYRMEQRDEKYGLHTLYKAEAINHDTQMGETIWVRDLSWFQTKEKTMFKTNAEAFKALKAKVPSIWKEMPNAFGDSMAKNSNGYWWRIEFQHKDKDKVLKAAEELGIKLNWPCCSETYCCYRVFSVKHQQEGELS